jgi:putative membrane protein
MITRHIQFLILCSIACSPAFALAQDPMAPPASQTQPNQPRQQMPGTTTSMQDSNTGGDTIQSMRDKTFVRKAASGGLAEVQFGQLAAQKGASDEVKSFGQKMVDDHTKLNEKMAQVADSLGVMLPKHLNKEDQAEYDKLNSLSGDAFDKEYITAMVKDHHADLREFRIEANSTSDPNLKQVITDGAQVIHDHMVMIDKIARSKGIATPGGQGKPAPPAS